MKKIFFALLFLLGLMTITAGRYSSAYAADDQTTGDGSNSGGNQDDPDGTTEPSGAGTTGDGGTPTPAS